MCKGKPFSAGGCDGRRFFRADKWPHGDRMTGKAGRTMAVGGSYFLISSKSTYSPSLLSNIFPCFFGECADFAWGCPPCVFRCD